MMKPSAILRRAKEAMAGSDDRFEIRKAVFSASGGDPYDLFLYLDALQFLKDADWDFDRAIALAKTEEK